MSQPAGVILFLMSGKGLRFLEGIVSAHLNNTVQLVVVGTDNNVLKDYADEIIDVCEKNNITWMHREKYAARDVGELYAIAVSWRWMIRDFPGKLVVFHDSLLPRYRGFAPLVSCLVNREKHIGVTALFASEEYDTGDIIGQKTLPVKYPIKIKDAIDLVSGAYAELGVEIIQKIENRQEIRSWQQDESKATYSLWRDEQDYRINWDDSSDRIKRFVDAVGFPYKGASTQIEGENIRITEVEVVEDVVIKNRDAGKVIFTREGYPVVVCGTGLVLIREAHRDGTGESILPLKKFRTRFT